MLTTADTMIKNVTFQGYIISSNAVKKRSIPLYSIVHSCIIERKKESLLECLEHNNYNAKSIKKSSKELNKTIIKANQALGCSKRAIWAN